MGGEVVAGYMGDHVLNINNGTTSLGILGYVSCIFIPVAMTGVRRNCIHIFTGKTGNRKQGYIAETPVARSP